MASRIVTCSITSRVQSCHSELIRYCHATFRIDKIAWKYGKTANIIEKTSVYHTVNGNLASKTAKMIKVILLSSTFTFWQGALSNYYFSCFRCMVAVNSVINWSFFYYRCNTVITTVINVMCWRWFVRAVWRCMYSFHAWGAFGGGNSEGADAFAQHSQWWMQTVLHIFFPVVHQKEVSYTLTNSLKCYDVNTARTKS